MKIKIIHPKKSKIVAAVIDWDGCISLLREGWQTVMREYIAKFIPSDFPNKKDYFWADDFIQKTIGENTVDQMLGMIIKASENGRKNIPADKRKRRILAEKHRIKYRRILEEKIRGERIKEAKNHPEEFINKGIKEFLKKLKERKIKIFVASGSEQKRKGGIEEETGILGLRHYFDAVLGYNGPITPYNKENVLKWVIKKHKIKNPLQVLVVGDGPKEIKVGSKFGAVNIGLISNNVTEEILLKSGADYIVYNATDLADCLNYIFI